MKRRNQHPITPKTQVLSTLYIVPNGQMDGPTEEEEEGMSSASSIHLPQLVFITSGPVLPGYGLEGKPSFKAWN